MSELLTLNHLTKHFSEGDGILDELLFDPDKVHAVDGVSFTLEEGEIFGLVGESGCGKSTLARTVLGLLTPDGGSVHYREEQIDGAPSHDVRRNVQAVFQDPYDSLNPRMTVHNIIKEPLVVNGIGDGEFREEKTNELLNDVGLDPADGDKYPHQFSGGQQQRIAVARALALDPDLLVADEPVSSLDMSEQSRILNLLRDLNQEYDVTILFIAHDLNVVSSLCDRVGVMYLGQLVEVGGTSDLFENPSHPYTKALISAIPEPDPDKTWDPVHLDETKIPDPTNPPEGCRFASRCPIAEDKCIEQEPKLKPPEKDPGRLTRCFYPFENK